MDGNKGDTAIRWPPAWGTWEEAVLSWQEQVETAFRVRLLVSAPQAKSPPARSATTESPVPGRRSLPVAAAARGNR
jgi:hypothetical protein